VTRGRKAPSIRANPRAAPARQGSNGPYVGHTPQRRQPTRHSSGSTDRLASLTSRANRRSGPAGSWSCRSRTSSAGVPAPASHANHRNGPARSSSVHNHTFLLPWGRRYPCVAEDQSGSSIVSSSACSPLHRAPEARGVTRPSNLEGQVNPYTC
jgi:hypothetical protein